MMIVSELKIDLRFLFKCVLARRQCQIAGPVGVFG